MYGIPAQHDLLSLFFNEEACIRFLFDIGAVYQHRTCQSCSSEMTFRIGEMAWRCPGRSCRKSLSFRANSFFSRSNLPCSKILFIGYLWLAKCPVEAAIIQTGLSNHTICNYYAYYRQLISDDPQLEDNTIGGDNIVVEIDECKIGKRKYNRGHRVEGVWLLGGVERTPERRTFFVPVDRRDAQTLLPIIQRYVRPGSIIFSDLWRAYSSLDQLGYQHFTVNHSENFTNPVTGVCTNSIEGTWNGLKICIRPRNRVRDGIETRISEFQWRRLHKDDRWNGLLRLLRDIHYD